MQKRIRGPLSQQRWARPLGPGAVSRVRSERVWHSNRTTTVIDSIMRLEAVNRETERSVPLAQLALLLLTRGQYRRAHGLCAQAIALAPDNPELQAIAAEIFSHNVAKWYFPMVRDRIRHVAIEAALLRAIHPGSRVLDIGTGTGLFAMMAARAGAAEIVTCDSNPSVAAAATEVIARNGFANRVRVIAKRSTALEVGVDLAEPADVLIWDVLGSNLIGAEALPILEDAVTRLIRPEARVIPARGAIRVALGEDRELHLRRMNMVEGFDLSPFNRLSARVFAIHVGDQRLALRSEPRDLFRFDFQSGGPFSEAREKLSLTADGGLVNGVAQWLRFEMDDEVFYENRPSVGAISPFAAAFHLLRRTIDMTPGSKMVVGGTHDRQRLRIWGDVS
jgi:type III protein arginine methyltransferase